MTKKTVKYLLLFILFFSFVFFASGCGGSSNKENSERNTGGYENHEDDVTPASPAPVILNVDPASGPVDAFVTITGTDFGSSQGKSTVKFNGTSATPASWSSTSIICSVPVGAKTGNIVIKVDGKASNGVLFTVIVPAKQGNAVSIWYQRDTTEGISRSHIYAREYITGSGWKNLGSAATRIDDNLPAESGGSKDPRIAFDSSGNGIAVWSQQDTGENVSRAHIYARRYVAGSGWENLNIAATRLDDNLSAEAGDSFDPQITIDPSGNAIAVWRQTDNSEGTNRTHIYARRYIAGSGWEKLNLAATRLDNNLVAESGNSYDPQIAVDSTGNAMAIFRQTDNSEGSDRYHIYARRYAPEEGWENLDQPAARLDGDLPSEAGSSYYPMLCFGPSGNAFALWAQRDTSDGTARQHIYCRRYITGVGWENLGAAALRIDANLAAESGNSAYPKMTFNSSGNAFAVWTQQNRTNGTDNINVYARGYSENSGWENILSAATQIDANLPPESGNSYMPQISMDPSGNAIAVWYQGDNNEVERGHIYARRYVAGSGWENPGDAATRLDGNLATEAGGSFFPQIDFDLAGNAIAVWLQLDNSEGTERYHIYARRYAADAGWENLDSTATRIDANLETEYSNSNGVQIKFQI